jgi:hypothetical protein
MSEHVEIVIQIDLEPVEQLKQEPHLTVLAYRFLADLPLHFDFLQE